jgi:hypothetical protein
MQFFHIYKADTFILLLCSCLWDNFPYQRLPHISSNTVNNRMGTSTVSVTSKLFTPSSPIWNLSFGINEVNSQAECQFFLKKETCWRKAVTSSKQFHESFCITSIGKCHRQISCIIRHLCTAFKSLSLPSDICLWIALTGVRNKNRS